MTLDVAAAPAEYVIGGGGDDLPDATGSANAVTIRRRDIFRQIVPLALSYERRVLATLAKHNLVPFREVLNHLVQNIR